MNIFPALQFNSPLVNDKGGEDVLEMKKMKEITHHFTQPSSGLIMLPVGSLEVSSSFLQVPLNMLIYFPGKLLSWMQLQHLGQVSSCVDGFATVFGGKAC